MSRRRFKRDVRAWWHGNAVGVRFLAHRGGVSIGGVLTEAVLASGKVRVRVLRTGEVVEGAVRRWGPEGFVVEVS